MEASQNLAGEIRHLLNCPVCYQQYHLPKRLSCEHVFCSPCLQKLLRDNVIRCPECRVITVPSPPTVNSLPTCVIIQRFLEELFKNNGDYGREKSDDTNGNYKVLEETSVGIETSNNTNASKLKDAIRLNYQPSIEYLKETKRKIEENINSVRNSIDYVTHEIIRGIQDRRSRLMEEVDGYQRRWLKPLECQIDGLELEVHEKISLVSFHETKAEVSLCDLDLRPSLEISGIANAFECGRLSFGVTENLQEILDQVSNLGNILQDQNSGFSNIDDIGTEVTPVLNNQLILHGNFGPRGMCVLSRPKIDEVLVILDSGNRLCYELTPDVVRIFPLTNNNGSCGSFIDVTAINHGEKLIFSDYSSQFLKKFDLEFNEWPPIDLQIGSSSPLKPTPFSLASDRRGYIYVTDKRNRLIQVREESGLLVREFPCHGIPGYIAVWNDVLVVSDAGNKCCYIYSVDGRLLSTIGNETGVDFKMPMGVAFHEKGFIFVADYLKRCVSTFTISGQLCFDTDLKDYKINPEAIAIHKNTIYVSDRLNRNIIKIKLKNFPLKCPHFV